MITIHTFSNLLKYHNLPKKLIKKFDNSFLSRLNLNVEDPQELIKEIKLSLPSFSLYSNKNLILLTLMSINLEDVHLCEKCNSYKVRIKYRDGIENYFNDISIFDSFCDNCLKFSRIARLNQFLKDKGVTNASQLQSVKEKKKSTIIQNYGSYQNWWDTECGHLRGDGNPSKRDDVKKKKFDTLVKNYGSYQNWWDTVCSHLRGDGNPSSREDVKEKKRLTFQEHYGVDNIFELVDLVADANFKKYGFKSWSQTLEGRLLLREKAIRDTETQALNGERLCPHIGDVERECFNELQNIFRVKIIRNARCFGYFLDGYIYEKNLEFEFDEAQHFTKEGNQIHKDSVRDSDLKDYIGCSIFRISIFDWLDSIKKMEIISSIGQILDRLPTPDCVELLTKDNINYRVRRKNDDFYKESN